MDSLFCNLFDIQCWIIFPFAIIFLWIGLFTGNGIAFDQFLNILYAHSQAEDCENEIMAAFAAQDRKGNGTISATDFKAIMCNSGEKVNPKLG